MENSNFEFFEDEEEDRGIDLIEIQRAILKNLLSLGISHD